MQVLNHATTCHFRNNCKRTVGKPAPLAFQPSFCCLPLTQKHLLARAQARLLGKTVARLIHKLA